MVNELQHERNDKLETLFQECLIDVILPDWTILESLSRLGPDSQDHALLELEKRPNRTEAYYDEGLAVLVKLELPHRQDWTQEQAETFFTSSAFHIATDIHYLQAHSARSPEGILGSRHPGSHNIDSSSLSIPSSPATFRGLGVRTPGFPYTPSPFPDLPDKADSQSSGVDGRYDDHTLGALISSATWASNDEVKNSPRWIVVQDGRAFVIWRLPKQSITWLPNASISSSIAITATITLRLGSDPALLDALFSGSSSPPAVPEKDNRTEEPSRLHRNAQTEGHDYVTRTAAPRSQVLLTGLIASQGPSDHPTREQDQIETAKALPLPNSRILKRACRRIMSASHCLDVTLRLRKQDARYGSTAQEKDTLCIEIANNPSNGIVFRIDNIEVKLDGSNKGIKNISSSNPGIVVPSATILSSYDQHNLVFNLEVDAQDPKSTRIASRNGPDGLLPPSTPLAALLTPSQVLQSGRPLDPRMRMARQPDASPVQPRIKEVQVIITGCPVGLGGPQREDVLPTAPFAMRWVTPFVDNLSSPLAQEGKRRPVLSPATIAASTMKKQATSIGVRGNGISVPTQITNTISGLRSRPHSSVQGKSATVSLSSQSPVQATAGSKRHTVAGLTQISQRMAYMSPLPALSPLPAMTERPGLSRQPSRASAADIGIGQPPLNLQSPPSKNAIPSHMVQQLRPSGPTSPKRSVSASALPTINTIFNDPRQRTQVPSPSSYSASPVAGLAPPLESGGRQADYTSQRGGRSPLRSFTERPLLGRDVSPGLQPAPLAPHGTPGTIRQVQMLSKNTEILNSAQQTTDNIYEVSGRILISVAVLPSKETAASLGLALGSEAVRDQADEDGSVAMMRTRLAAFKLGTSSNPSSPPLAGVMSPQQNILAAVQTPNGGPALRFKGAVAMFDIFLIEIFILNTSNSPVEMLLRAPISINETGKAGIMPLDNRVSIGPLAPQACESVRMRFLALQTGVHEVESISVLDLAAGKEHSIRQPVTVVVA